MPMLTNELSPDTVQAASEETRPQAHPEMLADALSKVSSGTRFEMSFYTVYDSPTDFPERVVVRRFSVGREIIGVRPDADTLFLGQKADGSLSALATANSSILAKAREAILEAYPFAFCIGRMAHDDAKIIETWL